MASISQLTARLVDLFGTPSTANPAKLMGNLQVSPNGNVLVGTSTDNANAKLQVNGGVTAIGYDNNSAQVRAVNGNYGSMIHNDGTSTYFLSTASGSPNGAYNAYRPFWWNMTTGSVGIATDGSGVTIGGATTHNAAVSLYAAGTYSPALTFNANGYAPFIRANSVASQIEFINSANTAQNATLTDGGVLSLPRARPNWLGYTPWDNGNLPYPCKGDSSYSFHWAGQSGTPAWVWGGSDGVNMYVYQPSVMSVNYANTCGTANNLAGGTTVSGTLGVSAQMNVSGELQAANVRVNYAYGGGGGLGLSTQGCVMSWNDNNGDGNGWLGNNQGGGAGGWVIRTVNSNNTSELGRFTISSGGVGTNGSDIRLKDNVETITDALSKICAIRGVSYSYKSNGEKHYGVIAQEVQPYFPDAVTVTHKVDDPGNFDGHEDLLGVSYTDLIGPLIEAVKELSAKVDTQSQQIKALQDQLESKQ
jgi:hypothetical protein